MNTTDRRAIRILVVEDERGIAMAIEDDLTFEGYEVVITDDGRDALTKIRAERFDLILLDVMLKGGRDGFDICRELRRTGNATPILMLTARTQEAEKVLGLESGADDYVTKPFGPRELRARIAALLRRSRQPETTPAIRVGDAEIDFDRGEIRRDGRSMSLTPVEFRLLQVTRSCEGSSPHPRAAHLRGLGRNVRDRSRGRQPHRQSAPQARARCGRAAAHPQRARSWLPIRRVKR